MRDSVAVAGATGFIGGPLVQRLAERYDVIGLSRRQVTGGDPRVQWRQADLFSLLDCERALVGARFAVYLVHSMAPSARMDQADFEDLDLLLADNFARAARRAGVQQIVFLGGLVPDARPLSPHLASRFEVEGALAAHGVPVTVLRAGMVVGPGGPSFELLTRLVRRLPVMACPSWTQTPAQPIDGRDVVDLLAAVVGDPTRFGETYDVGGPEVLTYQQIIRATAHALGKCPRLISIPLMSPGLSKLWVSVVTGSPRALVGPLVESLAHPMVARDRRLQAQLNVQGRTYAESCAAAVEGSRTPTCGQAVASTVRSVQRLPNPSGASALDIALAYLEWLPKALRPLLEVRLEAGGSCAFHLRWVPWPLLTLAYSPARSTPDRALLYVTGGLLAAEGPRPGRLEFRQVPGGHVLAAVHDFVPRLPWAVYVLTQAQAHLLVMRAFGRYTAELRPGQLEGRVSPITGHSDPAR